MAAVSPDLGNDPAKPDTAVFTVLQLTKSELVELFHGHRGNVKVWL